MVQKYQIIYITSPRVPIFFVCEPLGKTKNFGHVSKMSVSIFFWLMRFSWPLHQIFHQEWNEMPILVVGDGGSRNVISIVKSTYPMYRKPTCDASQKGNIRETTVLFSSDWLKITFILRIRSVTMLWRDERVVSLEKMRNVVFQGVTNV